MQIFFSKNKRTETSHSQRVLYSLSSCYLLVSLMYQGHHPFFARDPCSEKGALTLTIPSHRPPLIMHLGTPCRNILFSRKYIEIHNQSLQIYFRFGSGWKKYYKLSQERVRKGLLCSFSCNIEHIYKLQANDSPYMYLHCFPHHTIAKQKLLLMITDFPPEIFLLPGKKVASLAYNNRIPRLKIGREIAFCQLRFQKTMS